MAIRAKNLQPAKVEAIAAAKSVLEGCSDYIFADYRGLTVEQITELRKQLRAAGISYKVYKNTLVSRAVEGTEFESLREVLEGPSAFAISTDDATAPARVLAEFAKKAPKLEIKAGVVEGTYYDAKGMEAISSIPSREVLLGRLLGSMQSPIANFARVLNQIAEKGGAPVAEATEAPAEEVVEAPAEAEATETAETTAE